MSRITLLMPVYNGERFLQETIDSVLKQTYTDFVFLIINDGSTDRSKEIIHSFNDKRIVYYENEKNLGLVLSLNEGIEMVETEFLARMDADDLWERSKLEKQIQLLDTHPEIGLCGTSIRKFGKIEGDFIFPTDNEALKVGFLFYCTMSHPSVVFRMSFMKKSGLRYRTDYFPAEDYKMWIDCLQLTQIYNIPEILVFYRQHEEQICKKKKEVQNEKTNRVRLEMLDRLYPNFTNDEKEFHLQTFVEQNINSLSDFKKCVTWCKMMQLRNKQNGSYMQSQELKKGLTTYLQAGYKSYVMSTYFAEFSITSGLRYVFSFEWRYLSCRRNAVLLFKCFFCNNHEHSFTH